MSPSIPPLKPTGDWRFSSRKNVFWCFSKWTLFEYGVKICFEIFVYTCLYGIYIYIYVFNISLGPFEHLEIGTNLAKLSKHAERPQFVATVLPIRHCQRHNWPTVCASRSGAHLNTSQHPKHPQNWSVLLLQLKRRRKPETRSATNINSSKNNSANQHLSQPF